MAKQPVFINLMEARKFFIENDWKNKSDEELGELVGRSAATIFYFRKRLGLIRGMRKIKPAQIEELEEKILRAQIKAKLLKEVHYKLKIKYGIYKI